ncbi:unnamed protein product [Paramecium sonneborni]|uniref:FCP1 homology domain-containing protein n=1 Tax=Paramecium sonneborni TaxID=65129 RepID=A0A8S1R5Z5_9CILI|nr:unnamed protein product [Paramecium sonneborni]
MEFIQLRNWSMLKWDLNRIGRPLEKTIIIDNHSQQLEQENRLVISSWLGDSNDQELLQIKDLIIKIGESNVKDVRKALIRYRDYIRSRNKR